jgi:hypothetical protein
VIGPEFEKVFREMVNPLLKFMAPHRPVRSLLLCLILLCFHSSLLVVLDPLLSLLARIAQPFDRAMSIGCFAEVAEELGTANRCFVLWPAFAELSPLCGAGERMVPYLQSIVPIIEKCLADPDVAGRRLLVCSVRGGLGFTAGVLFASSAKKRRLRCGCLFCCRQSSRAVLSSGALQLNDLFSLSARVAKLVVGCCALLRQLLVKLVPLFEMPTVGEGEKKKQVETPEWLACRYATVASPSSGGPHVAPLFQRQRHQCYRSHGPHQRLCCVAGALVVCRLRPLPCSQIVLF